MTAAEANPKPAYLGLLNAIAVAESRAGVLLDAWAAATNDASLAADLRFVGRRETSHGKVFRRRLEELGYSVREREDPGYAARLEKLSSKSIGDAEKVSRFDEGDSSDPFAAIEAQLEAGAFDELSALLLRWYIAEERDSAIRLRAAYARLRAS